MYACCFTQCRCKRPSNDDDCIVVSTVVWTSVVWMSVVWTSVTWPLVVWTNASCMNVSCVSGNVIYVNTFMNSMERMLWKAFSNCISSLLYFCVIKLQILSIRCSLAWTLPTWRCVKSQLVIAVKPLRDTTYCPSHDSRGVNYALTPRRALWINAVWI